MVYGEEWFKVTNIEEEKRPAPFWIKMRGNQILKV